MPLTTTTDVTDARDWLRWFLEAIRRGEVTASARVVARLEDAAAALDAVARSERARPGRALWAGVRRQPDELFKARDGLRRARKALVQGEQTASRGYQAKLEGAIAALEALLGEPPVTTGVKGHNAESPPTRPLSTADRYEDSQTVQALPTTEPS